MAVLLFYVIVLLVPVCVNVGRRPAGPGCRLHRLRRPQGGLRSENHVHNYPTDDHGNDKTEIAGRFFPGNEKNLPPTILIKES